MIERAEAPIRLEVNLKHWIVLYGEERPCVQLQISNLLLFNLEHCLLSMCFIYTDHGTQRKSWMCRIPISLMQCSLGKTVMLNIIVPEAPELHSGYYQFYFGVEFPHCRVKGVQPHYWGETSTLYLFNDRSLQKELTQGKVSTPKRFVVKGSARVIGILTNDMQEISIEDQAQLTGADCSGYPTENAYVQRRALAESIWRAQEGYSEYVEIALIENDLAEVLHQFPEPRAYDPEIDGPKPLKVEPEQTKPTQVITNGSSLAEQRAKGPDTLKIHQPHSPITGDSELEEWPDTTPESPRMKWHEQEIDTWFVKIEPGIFWMGNERLIPTAQGYKGIKGISPPASAERPHRVKLTKPFWLAETPITQAQWRQVITSPTKPRLEDSKPMTMVAWREALEFCNTLSLKAGLQPCYKKKNGDVVWDKEASGYRLPTDAEWEYACRAGVEGRPFNCGYQLDRTQINFNREVKSYLSRDKHSTLLVTVCGSGKNDWDLYDLHGNVWELCWDFYRAFAYYPDPYHLFIDPVGPDNGKNRVIRGGAYNSPAEDCRSARRHYCPENKPAPNIGFRIARWVMDSE